MPILNFRRRARVLGAALLMSSTFAAVSSPAAHSATRSSFLDPTTLPICAKPGPQQPSSARSKPVGDPTVSHCAVAPANAGLHLEGFDNNKFLRLDAAGRARFAQNSGVAVVPGSACQPECQNGIQEVAPSGNRRGVHGRLEAQDPVLRADHQAVYNWIGIQNQQGFFSELVQIGLAYNSYNSDEFCGGNNNAPGRPIIAIQWAVSGDNDPFVCYPGYIFGLGSMTRFAVTDNGGGWWNFWVEWNGQWQALLGVFIPTGTNGLSPANAVGDAVPAEILELNSTLFDPLLGNTIHDDELQLNQAGSWGTWIANSNQMTDGPYCPTSMFSIFGTWTEVSDC